MYQQRKNKYYGLLIGILWGCVAQANTTPEALYLIFDDRILQLNFEARPEMLQQEPRYFLSAAGQEWPLDFDHLLPKEDLLLGLETGFTLSVSPKRLQQYFDEIALNSHESGAMVKIKHTSDGTITFSGKPNSGFEVDIDRLIPLINQALATQSEYVRVPAHKTFSEVEIDPVLQERGIIEVIAVGESNFTGSSVSRRQNILAGAQKFNGMIVKQGQTFSFNDQLKNVLEEDGFVPELVIKGNQTEKELGGGVCQVSTTVFRAAFAGGLPIVNRRNHSYAVPYYKPYGMDATIYLGAQDFRFKNDTPGDILIQAYVEGDEIYFVFYGTDDGRKVAFEGPFISNYREAPQAEYYETEDLPEGEMVEVSEAHAGFRTEWIRTVRRPQEASYEPESFVSHYRAWPAKVLRGIGRQDVELEPVETPPKIEAEDAYFGKPLDI